MLTSRQKFDKMAKENERIAIFCGYELTKDIYGHPVYKMPDHAYEERDENGNFNTIDTFSPYWDEMEFRTSWDWLIPVIDKITSLPIYGEYVDFSSSMVSDGGIYINTKYIEVTFEAVAEFIEWYETNKTA